MSSVDEPIYKAHEARIHGTVFDSLSKPLLSRSDDNNNDGGESPSSRHHSEWRHPSKSPTTRGQKHSNAPHITWNHFGQKHHIHLSEAEMAGGHDLLEILYRKIHALVPEFRGNLAYEDAFGHEVLLNNDHQLRDLLDEQNRRIRLFTTLSNMSPSHLAASEFSGHQRQNGSSRSRLLMPSSAGSEPNLLQKAREDISLRREKKKEDKRKRKPSPPAPQRLPFIGYGSGNVAAIAPPPPLGTAAAGPVGQFSAYWPVAFCYGHHPSSSYPHLPLFIRGSWIGPNKFWGGGSWGGGGGLWGGIGQIPSARFWHTAAGGRPPW